MPPDIPGRAESATLRDAAKFAWQEFIALNWPAMSQTGAFKIRDLPDTNQLFGQPGASPLVWETFRSRVELYPGFGQPSGYVDDPSVDFGYDALPDYIYSPTSDSEFEGVGSYLNLKPGRVPSCDGTAPSIAWNNLDENNEIGLATLYAGVAPGQTDTSQQILYLVKANRQEYIYVKSNGWYGDRDLNGPPYPATKKYITTLKTLPPPGSSDLVSLPNGTIEIKAGWRRLSEQEIKSGRFYVAPVRYYEKQLPDRTYEGQPGLPKYSCYRQDNWGLVALHVIQKTPSAPYFIYATFEQADNILDEEGHPVEDASGNLIASQQADPFDPNIESKDATPDTIQRFCPLEANSDPKKRLYYQNNSKRVAVTQGRISVNERLHPIPPTIIEVNGAAHRAIEAYNQIHKIPSSPWQYYKLVNVQWKPLDKPIPGRSYPGEGAATYYLANIAVETSYNLQRLSGGFPSLSKNTDGLITDFNPDGTPIKNVYYKGKGFNMGGCMGCHGFASQEGFDFSFTLLEGRVKAPERIGPIFESDPRYHQFAQLFGWE